MSNIFPMLILAVYVLAPVAAAVWALGTLHRLRKEQAAMRASLDRIERLLQRS